MTGAFRDRCLRGNGSGVYTVVGTRQGVTFHSRASRRPERAKSESPSKWSLLAPNPTTDVVADASVPIKMFSYSA